MVWPSGESATPTTEVVYPVRVRMRLPSPVRQSLMVRSADPLTAVRPSGENATDFRAFGASNFLIRRRGRRFRARSSVVQPVSG